MNKRIIVITTNLISRSAHVAVKADNEIKDEANYLFKEGTYKEEVYSDPKYDRMLAFWGECIVDKIDKNINLSDFDINLLGIAASKPSLQKLYIMKLIEDIEDIEDKKNEKHVKIAKIYNSYWSVNDGESNLEKRRCNVETKFNRVYKLITAGDAEVYALAHLPEEKDTQIFNRRSVEIVRKEWINAIKDTFKGNDNSTDLYIILHGKTDYQGESHHFTVVEQENNIAIFTHESDDEMVKILKSGSKDLSADAVADKVEALFKCTVKKQVAAKDNKTQTRGYYKQ